MIHCEFQASAADLGLIKPVQESLISPNVGHYFWSVLLTLSLSNQINVVKTLRS